MSRRSNSKNNNRYYSLFLLVALVLVSTNVYAFAPSQTSSLARQQHQRQFDARTSTTGLFERQWNFNEGQAPWGLKKNAELWNGRVAQVGGEIHKVLVFFFLRYS
jgi:hypothetical protein